MSLSTPPPAPPSDIPAPPSEEMNRLRCLTGGLERVHLLRGLHIKKTAYRHGLYFGQLPLLEYVASHDGCTGTEAAAALGVSTASVSVSTGRLQKVGLLDKQEDECDLRVKRLHITEEGRRRIALCHETFAQLDRAAYEDLSAEEQQILLSLLNRVSRSLTRALGDPDRSAASLQALLEELGPPPRQT